MENTTELHPQVRPDCFFLYLKNLISEKRSIIFNFGFSRSILKNKTFQPERTELKLKFQHRGKGKLKTKIDGFTMNCVKLTD